MNKLANQRRIRLLTTASATVAAAAIATAANAGQTVVGPLNPLGTTASVNGDNIPLDPSTQDAIGSIQINPASVAAQVRNTLNGIGQEESETEQTTITVDANEIEANSAGNIFASLIDLSVTENDEDGDGSAALGVSINAGEIASVVEANEIIVDLEDYESGSISVSENSIVGDASGNRGSTTLAGTIPNEFNSVLSGYSMLDSTPDVTPLLAEGSLLASTLQLNTGDIEAEVQPYEGDDDLELLGSDNNQISLDLISNGDNVVTSAPVVEDNTIAASARGNGSTSTIAVEGGEAPTFAGTGVITNGQANLGDVTASNVDSEIEASIYAEDDDLEDDINALQGSLSVSGNTISASASGNEALGTATGQAGNRIVLDDAMSFSGPSDAANIDSGYNSGVATSMVGGDLIIHNSQGNTGSDDLDVSILAEVVESNIDAEVQALSTDEGTGSSVTVAANTSSAMARGNAATSAFISGDNAALFSGSVALANQQANNYIDVTASNISGEIDAYIENDENDELADGTVEVDGNTQSASAYGNQVGQTASIAAAIVDLPADDVFLTGGTGPDGNVSADGGAVVSNLQSVYNGVIRAQLEDGLIEADIEAEDLVGSSLAVTGNTQQALALGSSASNGLSVAATSLVGGAGIVSVQIADDDTAILADVSAETSANTEEVTASSIEVSENLIRAIAYANSSANTLAIDAETVEALNDGDIGASSTVVFDPEADEGFVLDNADLPQVQAAYGLLNVQSAEASVIATVSGDEGDAIELYVDENADAGSSLVNDDNMVVAAAYGNETANAARLTVGNLTSDDDGASVLNLTNVQTVADGSNVVAEAAEGALVHTEVYESVVDSSVSTSGNTVQAVSFGNLADNDAVIEATNIGTGADEATGSSAVVFDGLDEDVVASVEASFAVNNVQFADGGIVASLVDDIIEPEDATWIVTEIGSGAGGTGGDVLGSSVVSNGNTLSAGATANRADDLLDLAGNNLVTTGALVNFQMSEADLTTRIGVAGTDPTPAVPGTDDTPGYTVTNEGAATGTMQVSGDALIVGSPTTLTFTGASFTQREVDYLNGLSGVSGATLGGNSVTLSGTVDTTEFNGFSYNAGGDGSNSGDESITLDGFDVPLIPGEEGTPAIPGSPNQGGIVIAVRDDVIASTLSIDGNTIAGSVTGNSASNTVAVDVNSAAHASDQISTLVELRSGDSETLADFGLTNVQLVDEGNITSQVYGTLAIDFDFGSLTTFTTSTLTIEGNEQSSRAVANTAVNVVDFDATNTDAGAALASNQISDANVESVSDLDMFVPVAGLESSVSVSDNTNLALGVGNNVSNELTVSGTNLEPVGAERDVRLLSDGNIRAGGDHILANQQLTVDDVAATANTTVWNDDAFDGDGTIDNDGIRSGSVVIGGNTTVAEATANRALNTATVGAGSTLTASAGLANYQATAPEMGVTANASTNASVVLGSAEEPLFDVAVDAGSVVLGQNTTSALARGNAATNVLNYSAGSNFGGTTIGSDPYVTLNPDGENTVRARAGVLNNQSNNAAINATALNTSYVVALNSDDGPTVTNATIGVIGNAVSAAAYGNTATNTLRVSALNTNAASAAIGNVQYNGAPVTATATTIAYGVTSGVGAATGSSIGVSGNAITATAVGNNAVSSIIGN